MAGQRSQYILENRNKYKGANPDNIICRSSWERSVCKFFDNSPSVVAWSSESVMVRYLNILDNKYHRYYIDFAVEMKSGKRFLIEVKPHAQTQPPKLPASGRKTKSFLDAQKTFVVNKCKWKAAQEYAERNGVDFVIWTEHVLKKIGIQIVR